MSDEELKQNTLEYAKNLRLIADLTGEDVKAAKEKKKAILEESQLQSLITRMSKVDPNAGDKVTNAIRMIENLGFSTDDAIKYINRGVMTGDAALLGNAEGVREALAGIRTKLYDADPSVSIKDFTGSLLKTVQENSPRIEQSVLRLGDIAATGGDRAVALTAGIGKLAKFTEGVDKLNVDEYISNVTKAAETQDKLAQGIASLEQSKVDMAVAVQDLATQLTTVSAPVITGAIDQLATAIRASADGITSLIEGFNPTTDQEKIQKIVTNDKFKEMEVGESLSMSPFADREIKSQIADFINSLTDAGKTQEEITKELAKIGIERGYGDLTFSKIQPTAPVEPTKPETPTAPAAPRPFDSINPSTNVPEKAYGDIVKPTPGGRIVRVAEAGEAEAILPTERTQGGQLGIKVTGDMFDSSYLMKTLVDTNKGGNSLLATLVAKIDGLNTNFEKLVTEQRQANRLAV
jgi:hypothetical protein